MDHPFAAIITLNLLKIREELFKIFKQRAFQMTVVVLPHFRPLRTLKDFYEYI